MNNVYYTVTCRICTTHARTTMHRHLLHGKLSIEFADDEFGEKTVSILLDGEESEMVFIDHPSIEMSVSVHV